jgi:hypothetical protein
MVPRPSCPTSSVRASSHKDAIALDHGDTRCAKRATTGRSPSLLSPPAQLVVSGATHAAPPSHVATRRPWMSMHSDPIHTPNSTARSGSSSASDRSVATSFTSCLAGGQSSPIRRSVWIASRIDRAMLTTHLPATLRRTDARARSWRGVCRPHPRARARHRLARRTHDPMRSARPR